MTARQIDAYLKAKGSPLAGHGRVIVNAGRRYGIDPALLVAISGAETSFGTAAGTDIHNAWGWGPGIKFPSWRAAINTVARGLKRGYYDQGLTTIPQIQQKWAPSGASNDPTGLNNNWIKNVTHFYGELGGVTKVSTTKVGQVPQLPKLPSAAPAFSPAEPTGGMDLAGVAMQGLQALAHGAYDPTAGLQALQEAQAAQPPPQAPQRGAGQASDPFPDPAAPEIRVQAGTTLRDRRAVALIRQYLGTPYHWGGTTPQGGFDCSGLVQFVWAHQGVKVPRTTYEQWKAGKAVKGKLRAGDVVFFEPTAQGPGHEGLYIGGGKFIEAPHTGAVVRVSKLAGRKDYMGARRFA